MKTAAPLIAAPALLSNRKLFAAPTDKLAPANPPLEVLYDTLGNATEGWGWVGQGGYTSTFSNSLSLNYIIVTCYLGTLSNPKRFRGFECAVSGYNFASDTNLPPSYFLGRFYLGIWRTDVGTFYQAPLGGSLELLHSNLSNPNVGSVSTPVGSVTGGGVTTPIYVIGWDNFDVLLPANVPIQIAFYAEGIQLGDAFFVSGTSRPGPNMLSASTSTGNGTIIQPMACRLTVSDEIVTAANADISGRVVNQSGRGISRARITLQNTQTGKTFNAMSNPVGYFRFTDQPAGNFYIMSVNAKGLTFQPNTRTLQLLDNITNLQFVGSYL